MNPSDDKGRDLEKAVEAIEAVILQTSPALREQPFKIETRKNINVGGVRHEIDVFVTVNSARGYESIFIFECKNWESAVSKNEIIVFSEKIKASGAQRGYFVARSLTKDAQAQAHLDPRITLLDATEHDPALTLRPEHLHFTAPVGMNISKIEIRSRGASGKKSAIFNTKNLKARLGENASITDILNQVAFQLYKRQLSQFRTVDLPEGVYPMPAYLELGFETGDLTINDQDIEFLRIEVEYQVQVCRPPIISDFEILKRGRAIRFETFAAACIALELLYVTTPDNTSFVIDSKP